MLFHMGKIMAVPWDFPVVSWYDDRVGGLDANWNCEAPTSELCLFKQMIQNVIAFFLPTSSLWQRNKGLWWETTWKHCRWLPGASESVPLMHSHPLPCKKAQWQLVPPGHQTAGMHEVPSLCLCVTLAVLISLMLLSHLFTFQGWSGFCSWAVLTAALTLQSALLSLPGQAAVWPCVVLKGCMREPKEETRGSS